MIPIKFKSSKEETELITQANKLIDNYSIAEKALKQQCLFDTEEYDKKRQALCSKANRNRLSLMISLIHFDNGITSYSVFQDVMFSSSIVYLNICRMASNWFSHTSHSTTD